MEPWTAGASAERPEAMPLVARPAWPRMRRGRRMLQFVDGAVDVSHWVNVFGHRLAIDALPERGLYYHVLRQAMLDLTGSDRELRQSAYDWFNEYDSHESIVPFSLVCEILGMDLMYWQRLVRCMVQRQWRYAQHRQERRKILVRLIKQGKTTKEIQVVVPALKQQVYMLRQTMKHGGRNKSSARLLTTNN